MIPLDFRYIEHIIKCLEQKVSNDDIVKTIDQLGLLVIKKKNKIKMKDGNSRI